MLSKKCKLHELQIYFTTPPAKFIFSTRNFISNFNLYVISNVIYFVCVFICILFRYNYIIGHKK